MNIFDLDKALVDRYAAFARSFSTIKAPDITEQVNSIYDLGKFWPDPLITINPHFEHGSSMDQLADDGVVDPALRQIFAFGQKRAPLTLHRHQERAVAKARNQESFVVTTGTGSGKSLCFFVPIVDAIVRARRAGEAHRTRAIIIYPMNALANSQLGEIKKYIDESGIDENLRPTVARYTGQENEAERREIADRKPDILLTNFMMLELLMTRQDGLDQAVIGNAQGLEFLVLDELHTYRGRQGADVAMLVRRVKERLSADKKLICIGTSATMSSSQDDHERAVAVSNVATKLFGVPIPPSCVIDESLKRATSTAVKIETMGEQLRAIVQQPIAENLTDQELEAHPLACWIETQIGLQEGEKLRRRPPITLKAAAEVLAAQTALPLDLCLASLAKMLALIGKPEIERGGASQRAFLAFKLHRFISGAGRAYATLEPVGIRRVTLDGQLFLPDDPEKRLYPLFFCRECGQEHHSVSVVNDLVGQRVVARAIDEPARDEPEADGTRTGFLVPAFNVEFSGIPSDYPDDWQEVTASGQERLKASHRGKHDGELLNILTDGMIGSDGEAVWFFPGKYRFCPSCKHQPPQQARDINKLAGLSAEGRSSATTLIVSVILAWMERDGSLDPHTRKLLGFTDNRQDAALQAGHFNDFIFVTLLRGAILRAVNDAGEKGLAPAKFGEAIRHALGFELEIPDRLADWMLDPNAKGYSNRQQAEEVMNEVLAHRLWSDLRKGWRYTNPNLEEVGLISARFPGLDDLISDDTEFAENSYLSSASLDQRRKLYELLFQHMRQGLAVATDALDRQRVLQTAQESRQKLCDPWAIDRNEEDGLRESGFLMINPPKKDQYKVIEDVLIIRAGWRTNLGKALRDKAIWGEALPNADYEEMLTTLLQAAEAHQVVRRISSGFDAPAWRLSPSALRLFPANKRADEKRENPFFRDLYTQIAAMLNQRGGLPFSFEAREHTAQVDHEVRAWREDRFRFERDDKLRINQNTDRMREQGEPTDFLPAMFCSPTMELGVDISALNTVYMRNVPPTPANYAQRSGRAGRSGQAALVVTYCAAQSPHDQYYFSDRQALVAGVVRPPALDLANRDLLTSHLHAEWLAAASVPLKASIPENLDMTDAALAVLPEIRDSFERLSKSGAAQPILKRLVEAMLPAIVRTEAPWLDDIDAFVSETDGTATEAFSQTFERWRNLHRGARQEQELAHAIQQKTGLMAGERTAAATRYRNASRELEILERGRASNGSDFYSYRYLATEGFLPGYNFPRLPLYAFIPATQSSVLQRPRFLAISEFGPNSLIYHEGRAYRVTKAKLPADGRADNGQLTTSTLILCAECGAAHDDELQERCHACAASLGGVDRMDTIYRIDNVETSPSARITANDEDRQRRGFEIQTVFQWPMKNGVTDIRRRLVTSSSEPLLYVDYGASTKLSRINKGLRRRKSKSIFGFCIDPQTGRWMKDSLNGGDDDGPDDGDVASAKVQRIVPIVEDHKNAMLLRPVANLTQTQMATLQHALIRGIQIAFELEEGELLGEALPTRDCRNTILLYEATEGGAGVLNRLASQPQALPEVARKALELMHYKGPFSPSTITTNEDACVAGCYRCLLSYFNQPDHELIDRRNDDIVEFLCALATADDANSVGEMPGDAWQSAISAWGMTMPMAMKIGGNLYPLYWPTKDVLGVVGKAPPELGEQAAALGILDIIELPNEPGIEPPTKLLAALGMV